MAQIILFWVLVAVAGFAFALAIQMRFMVALVLRKALAAKFGGFQNDTAYKQAVVDAVNGAAQTKPALHLKETYPNPISHMRLARRYSVLAPVALACILLAGRFILGVI